MAKGPDNIPQSTLLVDEAFAGGHADFLELVRGTVSAKYLAGLADRWKNDPRPWARAQMIEYIGLPMDRPGHHPVVKRLFKHAEGRGDDEVMGLFLVAFDRLIRRQRRVKTNWNFQTRQVLEIEELFAPRNQILVSGKDRTYLNPMGGAPIVRAGAPRVPKNGRLFSYTTRGYLRRRVARYFRRMGFQRPGEYCRAVAGALAGYTDADTATGENILDNWSLMSLGFRRSPELRFTARRVEVAEGSNLGSLKPAPRFPKLWAASEAGPVLLGLLVRARSRLVRVWSTALLRQDHGGYLATLSAEQLLTLLDHDDEEVQRFGAGLIETSRGADGWSIETWLRLLETRSVAALATICAAMEKRVSAERLSLAQCVAMACARPTPVARLGLAWVGGKSVGSEADRAVVTGLAGARCDAVGEEAAMLGLGIVGAPGVYRTESVSAFFDSLNEDVRRGAWAWMTPESKGYVDPALWSRLLESPYDDVRMRLIEALRSRTAGAGPASLARQDLSGLWTSVLLNVHRGGRAKLSALRQISAAIAERPEQAEKLVPILVVAIRSVRPAEARAGMASLMSAVAVQPELETVLARHLPELRLEPAIVAAGGGMGA